MGHSSRLRISEVRKVFRLTSEVAQLRLQPAAQQTCLANGLCELLDAVQGYTVRFEGFDAVSDVRITRMYPGGYPNLAVLEAWRHWESQDRHALRDDPLVNFSARQSASGRDRGTYVRSEVIDDSVWYGSPVFEFLLDHVKVEHLAVSWFRLESEDVAIGFAAQRMRGDRAFTHRERNLLDLLNAELYDLYARRQLTGAGAVERSLSPRQVQLLRLLLLGQAPKRIAYDLGLTEATIRTYIRDLYRKIGVSGREELMALYIREGGIDGPKRMM